MILFTLKYSCIYIYRYVQVLNLYVYINMYFYIYIYRDNVSTEISGEVSL